MRTRWWCWWRIRSIIWNSSQKNHKRRREAAFYAHLHWRSDTGFTGSPSDTGHFLQCVWPLTSLMRLWTVRTSRNTHLGTFKLKRLTLHSGAPHRLVKWSFWVWFEHLPPPLIGWRWRPSVRLSAVMEDRRRCVMFHLVRTSSSH